jgi:hypothetical protein
MNVLNSKAQIPMRGYLRSIEETEWAAATKSVKAGFQREESVKKPATLILVREGMSARANNGGEFRTAPFERDRLR